MPAVFRPRRRKRSKRSCRDSASGDAKAPYFGRKVPFFLEIGFGMGDTTAKIAASMPDKDFIGVEVHMPGVGSRLERIGERMLTNLRIIQHAVFEVVTHMI